MQMNGIHQDLDASLAHPALKQAFEARRPAATAALANWLSSRDPRLLAFRRSLERDDDLGPAKAVVSHLSAGASDVIVLGTGGSSLGAQAIAQLSFWGTPAAATSGQFPRLHFVDNLDGSTFQRLLGQIDLRTTRFHVVSKSGSTADPLLLMLAALDAVEREIGVEGLTGRFSGEAELGPNPVRRLLEELKAPVLEHDPDLGGRFTAFSTVGLVPAMIAGLDVKLFRQSGLRALAAAAGGNTEAADGAALSVAASDIGLSQQVMWNYTDRLDRFAKWWRQLWAESLGKSGRGTTPVDALGPVDQHSQLQLYLDGPADKLFTLISPPKIRTLTASVSWAKMAGLDLFAGRDLADVTHAQARATAETLRSVGRPVRVLSLATPLDEKSLAELMLHFILETLVAASLWDVDPFGQPAVETGKHLTRKYLEAAR